MNDTTLTRISETLNMCLPEHINPHYCMAIIKIMLQTHGVDLCGPAAPRNSDGAGVYLIIRDDLLKIEVPVYTHRSKSGYQITLVRNTILIHGRPLLVEFERPYFSHEAKIDGVSFRDICNVEYDGHLALTANHGCLYFKQGNACRFCSIPQWRDAEDRSLKRLINASTLAISLGEVKHLSLTTGTAPGADRGIRSILTVLSSLKETARIAGMPIFAEFEPPKELEWLDMLRQAGVTTISCNLEFLTPARRAHYMPGKAKIPFEHYLQVWERAVLLFGRGQVFSNILMAEDDIPLPNQLSSEELKAMVSVGVIPSPGPLYPDPASELANAMLPSVQDQVSFLVGTANLLYSENLDPRQALAGCHRNGSYSAINQFYAARTADFEMDTSPLSRLEWAE
ncbi:hypothetical protein FS594_26800 (plasmid) [Rahnella aquatilis]|uniref:Radical SAM core domain-containing protein n=1 Tax=Rahnella perminowiae TaxID=2816244 RepID=A0ABS6KVD0_9GAMM|nr:radical SAM protein [Rahnella perminowiae]MBU9833570.1 hypothetical protein [Rahnella perminowiae]UJD92368.1 hypothetical protein FS594_26800 [Rahnella aquatilis]